MPDFSATGIAQMSVETVYKELGTTSTGLMGEDARRRLAHYGLNRLRDQADFSALRHFLNQFTHFLAILLWIAAGLSFLTEYLEPGKGVAALGWVIVGVIVINAMFAFVQEYRADRTAHLLQRLLPATAWVLRAGQPEEVPREEIVPGDLLLLEEGHHVSADARVVEAFGMRADNSSLTGESIPRRRITEALSDDSLTDLSNLVFAGTTIVSGHGRAVVYATGAQTEFGRTAHLATTVEAGPSPLQREIAALSRVVGLISLVIGLLFFAVSFSMGLGLWISAIFGIGLIAANVPEGLLPTVTFALAMATQRMAKRKALIKQLASVETLGCTTVICTDKTGTITVNRMTVDRLYFDDLEVETREGCLVMAGRVCNAVDSDQWRSFFDAVRHCHNVTRVRRPDGRITAAGDPTEVALVEFAQEQGLLHRPLLPRMGEIPFDADRKRMTTLHRRQTGLTAFVKGAPESVIPLCEQRLHQGTLSPMTPSDRQRLLAQSRAFAARAYRVLAMASREIVQSPELLESGRVEQQLTFLGLVAMIDPPHREVPEAVARCHRAGIRVVMITGDHPLTAVAIARQVGLIPPDDRTRVSIAPVIEGRQLDDLTDEQVRQLLTPSRPGEREPIFARMAPRHKMRIVTLLKDMGEIVAVTGDGVNDAPALKKADIGVAMGIAGTDVAKETADMILLDDNFATIVNAIEEGRAVFANIRKFVTYVFSSNVAEMLPYLGYGLFRMPLALTVPQLLAIDLGTNMMPAIALGSERPHQGIMAIPPRPRSEHLMDKALFLRVFGFLGVIEGVIALGAFFWFLFAQGWTWGAPLDWSSPLYRQATTVTFAAIVLGQVANAFASRSDRISILQLGLTSNRLTLVGVGVALLLLMLIVYSPMGNWLLGTAPIPFWMWGPLLLGSAGLLVAEEGRKMLAAKLWWSQPDPSTRTLSEP
ncbi:MAG: ATPase [Nitrospira sp.]